MISEQKRAYNLAYRAKNRERLLAADRKRYADNIEQSRARSSAYAKTHRSERQVYERAYHEKNKDRKNELRLDYNRAYRANARIEHPQKIAEQKKAHAAKRRASDPIYRLVLNARARVKAAVRSQSAKKSGATFDLLGCTCLEFRTHLEKGFKVGMTWENYGIGGWVVDHVRPISSFDLSDPAQQMEAFSFRNTQPLWEAENIAKGDKWEP